MPSIKRLASDEVDIVCIHCPHYWTIYKSDFLSSSKEVIYTPKQADSITHKDFNYVIMLYEKPCPKCGGMNRLNIGFSKDGAVIVSEPTKPIKKEWNKVEPVSIQESP